MRKSFPILFAVLCIYAAEAQPSRSLENLNRTVAQAENDTAKITALNNLVAYYFNRQQVGKADSVLARLLHIAEPLDNRELLTKVYFDNPATNIVEWSSSDDFDKVIRFIHKGIDYAKKLDDKTFTVVGYTRLAAVLRKRGKYSEAMNAITLALSNMKEVSDSTQATVYIEFGNYWLAKEEYVTASTNYNNAFKIAIRGNNHFLESDAYRCLAHLNEAINAENESKDFLIKSLQVDKKYNNGKGLVEDFIQLARHEPDEDYIGRAIVLADSLGFDGASLRAKEIRLAIYLNDTTLRKKAMAFLESQPDLLQFYMRAGIENYYYERGTIHFLNKNPDSALYYFTRVEPYMLKNFDIKVASNIYLDMGDCYSLKNDWRRSIDYYLKSLSYYQHTEEVSAVKIAGDALSFFYKQNRRFDSALYYKEYVTAIKDSLANQTESKEVALLDVERKDNLNKEIQRQTDEKNTRNRNLQYMLITIAICVVFLGMLVLGTFPISRLTIRLFGYFFFISLFEFIVLLLDNNIIHTITQGEPLKLWLVKIVLIGMLVPVQHFLEHGITKFLESRQLVKARKKFSIRMLLPKSQKRSSKRNTKRSDVEDDTAVL